MNKSTQRMEAEDILIAHKRLGYSSKTFLELFEWGDLTEREMKILSALDNRGELKHLIEWVWTFRSY